MRVSPANDQMRKLLKHPSGVGFREKGSANWPDDSFTHRRIQDGSIVAEGDSGMRVAANAHVVKADTPRSRRTEDKKPSE